MLVPELKDIAEKMTLKGYKKLNKQELIYKILDNQALSGKPVVKEAEEKKETKPKAPAKRERKKVEKKEPVAALVGDSDVEQAAKKQEIKEEAPKPPTAPEPKPTDKPVPADKKIVAPKDVTQRDNSKPYDKKKYDNNKKDNRHDNRNGKYKNERRENKSFFSVDLDGAIAGGGVLEMMAMVFYVQQTITTSPHLMIFMFLLPKLNYLI